MPRQRQPQRVPLIRRLRHMHLKPRVRRALVRVDMRVGALPVVRVLVLLVERMACRRVGRF